MVPAADVESPVVSGSLRHGTALHRHTQSQPANTSTKKTQQKSLKKPMDRLGVGEDRDQVNLKTESRKRTSGV